MMMTIRFLAFFPFSWLSYRSGNEFATFSSVEVVFIDSFLSWQLDTGQTQTFRQATATNPIINPNMESYNEEEDLTEEESLLQILPDEIVLHIFSYLSFPDLVRNVSLVNRRFRHLSLDPSLWTRIMFPSTKHKLLSLTEAHVILDRCSLLEKLVIKYILFTRIMLEVKFFLVLFQIISRRDDSDLLAIYALQMCPRLKHLDLVYCETASDVFAESIGEYGKQLRTLKLRGNGT